MANTTETRTFAESKAPIDSLDDRGFARVIADALQAHYGPLKSSAKRIANDCGASVQTAKNWLSGLCPPSSIYLMRLERKVPGLAAEMRRLQGMETEFNPEFQRELSALIRRLQMIEGA